MVVLVIGFVLGPLAYGILNVFLFFDIGGYNFKELASFSEFALKIYASGILIFFLVALIFAFFSLNLKKYRLSYISGIFGAIAFPAGVVLTLYFPFGLWVVLIAGALCLYSLATPVITGIIDRMGGNAWEVAAVTGLLSFVLAYWVGYQADIMLNQIFGVDPRHFTYSRYVAGFVVISPYICIASFFSLIFYLFSFCSKGNKGLEEDSSSNVGKKKSISDGAKNFMYMTGFFSSYVVFSFSIVFWEHGEIALKKIANVVDFNPVSICSNIENNFDVVYLDKIYNLVLVSRKNSDGEYLYNVAKCDIKI